MQKIRKAVIPAAGLGTRFYPLTRAQPKEMLPILDKPVIHYVVEEAVNSGLDEILIIVGAGKDAIINYFDSSPMDNMFKNNSLADIPDIYFVRQKNQKGLADSITYSRKFVGSDPFVVLLGDTIYRSSTDKTVTSQLIEIFEKWKKPVLAVEEVERSKIKDYGIIEGNMIEKNVWDIKRMVEKPDPTDAPSNMGITGTYILEESIFDAIKKTRPGKNGEFQLTDALSMLCSDNSLIGYKFNGTRYDIGTKELWIRAFIDYVKDDQRFRDLI